MIKSDDITNGEWVRYLPIHKQGVRCYRNNVIQRWFLMWVCERACTKFCFNAWLAKRSLTHQNLIPVCIRGLPVWVRGGRPEILHMGSPRSHYEIVRILGATYIYIIYTELLICTRIYLSTLAKYHSGISKSITIQLMVLFVWKG